MKSWEDSYKSALEKLVRIERFEEAPEDIIKSMKNDLDDIKKFSNQEIRAAEAMSDIRCKIYNIIEIAKYNVERVKSEISSEKKHNNITRAYKKASKLGT